jgi:hypothetical protein
MERDERGRVWPWYTRAEWEEAYDKAAAELGLPPRGPRCSVQNRVRRQMRSIVLARARQIVWLERAARREQSC